LYPVFIGSKIRKHFILFVFQSPAANKKAVTNKSESGLIYVPLKRISAGHLNDDKKKLSHIWLDNYTPWKGIPAAVIKPVFSTGKSWQTASFCAPELCFLRNQTLI